MLAFFLCMWRGLAVVAHFLLVYLQQGRQQSILYARTRKVTLSAKMKEGRTLGRSSLGKYPHQTRSSPHDTPHALAEALSLGSVQSFSGIAVSERGGGGSARFPRVPSSFIIKANANRAGGAARSAPGVAAHLPHTKSEC